MSGYEMLIGYIEGDDQIIRLPTASLADLRSLTDAMCKEVRQVELVAIKALPSDPSPPWVETHIVLFDRNEPTLL